MVLVPHKIVAQQNPVPAKISADDRSPYLGQPVNRPESLSGLWETSNGNGGAVGIHFLLTTTIPGDATTLEGVQQSWQHLEVGVYERKGTTIQFGEQNYFSDSQRGGGVSFEDGRLRLHFIARVATDPPIDLDLLRNSDGSWTGRFHRGTFDSMVTLRRPAGTDSAGGNIVGTWLEDGSSNFPSCIHIAKQSATEYVGWSDALQILGGPGVGGSLPRPEKALERYGELAKVTVQNGDKVSLELYAYNPICCPHTFVGTLTAEGTVIQGAWAPGTNQAPHDARWRKMPGDSCISSQPR